MPKISNDALVTHF